VWVAFVIDGKGDVLSGEPLPEAARVVEAQGAEAILVNCAPPDDITHALAAMRSDLKMVTGAYAHIGRFDPPSWKFEFFPQFSGTDAWPPDGYLSATADWQQYGAQIVGGCCGTGPDHVRALARAAQAKTA
jgi:S-methylmethionine-dependent homocysteine/selenocysteine methylase